MGEMKMRAILYFVLLLYVGASTFVIVPVNGLILGVSDFLLPIAAFLGFTQILVRRLRYGLASVLLFGYLISCFISLLAVAIPIAWSDIFMRFIRLVGIVMPFFLVSVVDLRTQDVKRLFRWFIMGGGISIALGLVAFFLKIDIREGMQQFNFGTEVRSRAQGVFGDAGAYGALWAVWFVTVSAFWLKNPGGARGILRLGLYAALTSFAVYASLSRGGFLGAVLALLLLPFVAVWSRKLRPWILFKRWGRLMLAILLLSALGWLLAPDRAREVLIDRYLRGTFLAVNLNDATSGRLENWLTYSPYWLESPLIGIGYKALILGYQLPPDNMYLSALVETGVLGFFFLFSFVIVILIGLGRRARKGNYEAFVLFLVWVVVLSIGFVADVFTYWGVMPAVLLLTGAVLYARDG